MDDQNMNNEAPTTEMPAQPAQPTQPEPMAEQPKTSFWAKILAALTGKKS